MRDVAAAAGVSVTTVSHVVNRTRPVAADTERRVLEAVAQVGYVPDDMIRNRRKHGSRTIGVAISSLTNPYFGELVSAIERSAAVSGYSILLTDTHDTMRGQIRAMTELLERHVEAVVLAPAADPTGVLRQADGRSIPVILVDRFSDVDVDQIGTANIEPTARLVDHLVGHGHSRIGMIYANADLSTTQERIAGFTLGLDRNAVERIESLVASGDNSEEGARRAFVELMSLPKPPTALVSGSNQMTIGIMQGAHDLGLAIPDDLALVVFDDFPWADFFHPRLTAIGQQIRQIGEQCVSAAIGRMSDRESPSRRIVLEPTMKIRESCGCSSANAKDVPAGRARRA